MINRGETQYYRRIKERFSLGKEVEFGDVAEIYSFTIVMPEAATEEFLDQAPYVLVMMRLLKNDKLVTAMATQLALEIDEVKIGMKMEAVPAKIRSSGQAGVINYGTRFRPDLLWNSFTNSKNL